ncbi:MAG: hypothetical protein P9M07_01760 [Candidatus Aceula meridiana]|nr:hypothetical protein [Candidatus Aceula meridiana]
MSQLIRWRAQGKPIPPPHLFKQQLLKFYSNAYGLRTLIETGTYNGQMIQAMDSHFDSIYSIELSEELYHNAINKFHGKPKIKLIYGDSGKELGNIIKKVNEPALFWLDGHYSGGGTAKGSEETPIVEEIQHILDDKDRNHVILIDDARLFGSNIAYPAIESIERLIKAKWPQARIVVKDDIIRITRG